MGTLSSISIIVYPLEETLTQRWQKSRVKKCGKCRSTKLSPPPVAGVERKEWLKHLVINFHLQSCRREQWRTEVLDFSLQFWFFIVVLFLVTSHTVTVKELQAQGYHHQAPGQNVDNLQSPPYNR